MASDTGLTLENGSDCLRMACAVRGSSVAGGWIVDLASCANQRATQVDVSAAVAV